MEVATIGMPQVLTILAVVVFIVFVFKLVKSVAKWALIAGLVIGALCYLHII